MGPRARAWPALAVSTVLLLVTAAGTVAARGAAAARVPEPAEASVMLWRSELAENSGVLARPKPAEDSGVLWRADHEEGDLSDWDRDDCGGQFNNGAAYTEHSNGTRNGTGGMRLRVPNMNAGISQGARAFRWCEATAQRALYYSAWYYIPGRVRVRDWWWLMEWKSEGSYNAKFGLAVGNRRDGQMYVLLERGQDSGGGTWAQDVKNLPARRWVHLEAYYEKATTPAGRIVVWQDGTRILDVSGVSTANSADLRWAVVNYGQDTSPSDVDVYIDDAAIGTRRLGP